MNHTIALFKKSFGLLFKDQVNLIFTLIPLLLGILIYSTGFYYLYDFVMINLKEFLEGLITPDSIWLTILYYFVKIMLTIFCFFMVNWTFVLIVSVIASPFNDLISERVEKKLVGKKLDPLPVSLKRILAKLGSTLINETKKILFIAFLSLIALVCGYVPILTPIALMLTFLLVSIQFVDYTWSRHDLSFKACVSDMMGSVWNYTMMGGLYFFFINIPLLNLLTPALATTHYTAYYCERKLLKSKENS